MKLWRFISNGMHDKEGKEITKFVSKGCILVAIGAVVLGPGFASGIALADAPGNPATGPYVSFQKRVSSKSTGCRECEMTFTVTGSELSHFSLNVTVSSDAAKCADCSVSKESVL